MIPALLTAFLWSLCVVASNRSVKQLGENAANFWRMLLALAVLGILAHSFGMGLAGAGLLFFFLSGVIGFGFGDIGIFYALPRIGSRLTILMAQCLAAPIAGFAEWLWLGTVVSSVQIFAVTLILSGVAIALCPSPSNPPRIAKDARRFWIGVGFGLLAAFGQGMGAVLSRKAYIDAELAGELIRSDSIVGSIWLGATAGYQRLWGGIIIVAIFYLLSHRIKRWRTYPEAAHAGDSKRSKFGFIAFNATTGPIVGLICFQWALATTPSMIVQPIVAMTPLIIMPLAWWMEGDRPSLRAILGAIVAVLGVIALAWAME